MARPREFNQEDAIKGATDIFWRQGFKATSLPDLLKSMRMTRGSFYLAFGTKQNVYALAMDYYDQNLLSDVVTQLETCDAPEVWDCLAPLFQPGFTDQRGCFICNAMTELGPENKAVADKANQMAMRLRDAIQSVLSRRKARPDASSERELADLILHLYFGYQAIGKAGNTKNNWEDTLKRLLAQYSDGSHESHPA
ncbi:MAG: TetR/AcrR family transcriptional regulator [Arenibacterium sp.]